MKGRILVASVLLGTAVIVGALRGCAAPTAPSSTCGLANDDIGRFVHVPSDAFVLGAHAMYPEERRAERVFVSGFSLQIHEVTNGQFARFVRETDYITLAERGGGSAVFSPTSAWRRDPGATWQTPEGVGSSIEGRGRHPVVHVALDDARAYAAWAGGRLPTEIEWEYAASLGLLEPERPDSGAFGPRGEARANIWNGRFPDDNSGEDGFVERAPVGCYPASRIGAFDMLGNVWEWTETPFDAGRHTMKGGSYLCAETHCHRYRVPARQGYETGFSAGHLGFRIVRDTR